MSHSSASTRISGFGRGAILATISLIAAFAMLAVSAGSAAAAPVTYTFDNGRVNFGIFKNVTLLPAPANVEGTPNPEVRSIWSGDATSNGAGTTNLTFAPGDVKFPPVIFTPTAAVTGTVEEATGATTINLPLAITAIVGQVEVMPGTFAPITCTIAPVNLTLNSNGANTPFPGTDFSGGLGVNGAVSASWTSLPQGVQGGAPAPPGECDQLNGAITGAGGIWLANTLTAPVVPTPPTPPTPPAAGKANLRMKVTPRVRRAPQGKRVRLVAHVRNRGNARARGARVCVKAPAKRFVAVRRCVRLGQIPAGKTKRARFVVRIKQGRRAARDGARLRFRFIANARGAKKARANAVIRVR